MPFNSKYYVFIVLLFTVASAFCDECVLVKSEEEINWDMLPGSWYSTLNTHDPVEEGVTCYNLRDFKSAPDGSYVGFELIRKGTNGTNSCSMIPVHYIAYGTAVTKDPKFEFEWQEDIRNQHTKKSEEKAKLKESHLFYSHLEAVHTDYLNYFMVTMCTPNGDKLVWVQSRNPYPSDADIQRVKNKLASFGNGWGDVPLYPADCRKLTEFDCQMHD